MRPISCRHLLHQQSLFRDREVPRIVERQPRAENRIRRERHCLRGSQRQRSIPEAVDRSADPVADGVVVPRTGGGLVEAGRCRLQGNLRGQGQHEECDGFFDEGFHGIERGSGLG